MKFQNPSFNVFNAGRKEANTDKPKPICSPRFQSWGHNADAQIINRRKTEFVNKCLIAAHQYKLLS